MYSMNYSGQRNTMLHWFLSVLFLVMLVPVAQAQEAELSGTVVDESGMPLIGANVLIKGASQGTQTDFDGQFTITAGPDDVLVVSYIGYQTKEVPVGAQTELTITLSENASVLDEVVVTGYSKQARTTMTTSVSKLDTRILETSTRSNAATALQGTVAGLQITNTTGQPGSTPRIVLRGGTSFGGGGSPLILIDGVPGSFYALNADDIESIEVLKDAAATAIYGARSANGVILVTTKRGKSGQANINIKQKFSKNYRRPTPEYLGAGDFIKYNRQAVAWYREAANRPNGFAAFLDGPLGFGTGNNTTNSSFTVQYLDADNQYLLQQPGWSTIPDPLDPSKEILYYNNEGVGDLIYQNSQASDTYVSFDGGNEKGTYYLGAGYLDNDGLILGSGFKRYSGKFSGSYNIRENLSVNSDILYSHSNLDRSPLGSDNTVFRRFAGQPPTSRTYNNNPDGTFSNVLNPGTNFGFGNPLYYQDKFIRNNLEQRLSVSVGLNWKILNNLGLDLRANHFMIDNHNSAFNKAFLNGGTLITTRSASASLARTLRNQFTGMLNYSKAVGDHTFDALIGAEYYNDNYYTFSGATKDSPTDLIYTLNAGSEANGVPSSFETENAIVSAFGQLNYGYRGKYLLGFTFRRDGSSKLGNNKYGFFPGISLGWNVHDEDFFSGSGLSNTFSKIKPRLSYGVNGNLESVGGDYSVFGSYGSQGIYGGQTGYANTGLPTLDLRWERSTTLNFGLDVSVLDDRLSLIADYYIRDVEDKIANLTLPYWTGFSSIRTNNGTLRNKGLELQLNYEAFRTEDLSWYLTGTFTHYKNYVIKLPENDNELNRQGGVQIYNSNGELEWVGGLQEGQRVGNDLIVTYIQDYIYANEAEVAEHEGRVDVLLPNNTKRYPGDVAWVDVNGDNTINSFDRQVIGRSTPDVYGGFSSNLQYKNFGFYVKTDFAFGHLIYNHIRGKGLGQTQGNLNQDAIVLDSWTPENTETDVPRFVFVDAQKNIFRGNEGTVNSRFWEKGNYLALREITLSYDLSGIILQDQVKRLNFYLTGSNVAYFKSYSGYTPEEGGYQAGEFPLPRTLTFGLNLTF